MSFAFEPIGYVRSPFAERVDAPRQPLGGEEAPARIELVEGRGFEDALSGLEGWEYAWVIFVFHRNVEQARGWKPKVLPPRSDVKQGVFATRSPHRPNPIGLSCVRVEGVRGRVVQVRGVDLLEGTPVLDLKPYVAYADAHPTAGSGWLHAADPRPAWEVVFEERAEAQLAWLAERGAPLRDAIARTLALGPQPHAYRRIRPRGTAMELAHKAWRVDFVVDERRIVVHGVRTGYRPSQLATDATLELHRAFVTAMS